MVAGMSDRSTLEFRSNLYPVEAKGQLINDRAFLGSISDPFALDRLWRHNATRGGLLSKLQRRQYDKGQHCMYADADDYPWGTLRIGDELHVVCLCEKWDCPLMGKCRPGVSVPEIVEPEPEVTPPPEEVTVADEPSVVMPEDALSDAEIETLSEVESDAKTEGSFVVDQPEEEIESDSSDIETGQDTLPERRYTFQKHYDKYQARIVEADPTKRLYVTAGPGTGKTHTLIEKLKYMIDVQEVDPGSIMVMSFTRAAVQVVKDRLQAAALANELEGNWQAIDVTTFDKFCTRLLYWLKANEPALLGRNEIGRMEYDHRINAAAKIIRENPGLVSQCKHLVVDETQDLVKARARLVLALLKSLPQDCGITLLGDRCQSVYDYQANGSLNSEAFYDSLNEIGGFEEVSLEKNYRQNFRLPYPLAPLRKDILERNVESAGVRVSEILQDLGEPERELRLLGLAKLNDKLDGTLGILTRTNALATSISSLFYKHGVPHTLLRAEREAFWSRLIVDVLIDYQHETIDEDNFIDAAEGKGYSYEESIRAWIGLTSLRAARAEGLRYRVENLLQAMTEEVVPESLAATKSVQPGITISTIHGSKGREFDHVWLFEGDFKKMSSSKKLDEQKVAYVALSRARLSTSLQKSEDAGLKIDQVGNRCYRVSSSRGGRRKGKRLTHIELINSTDVDQRSLLDGFALRDLAESGELEGVEVRLCLPEVVPESGPIAYEIETESGFLVGKTTLSFISYYEQYYEKVAGELRYLPEAFDELYIDRIISCVGKSSTAPSTARGYGDYAVWYGFTLGGFAHVDNSQSH